YAPLRNEIFFSLEELNEAIAKLSDKHNNMHFQQEKISRKEKFEQTEKSKLQPLSSERFEIKYYKYATVMKNCHIQVREDKHYYSVPHRYIGKKVKLMYSASNVSVFYKHERIALHRRNLRNFAYSTIKEHLPSSHQFVADWNPAKFTAWAANISPKVEAYIKKIIESKVYPEQAYRSCVGILSFARKTSNERLIKAVERASHYGVYNYKTIKNIIEGKLDTLTEPEESDSQQKLPPHDNVRGAENYK
ncbi:MAG: IS21 family transposase, partial [Bacteroidales bacterium]|nr:IS21 family transposase [Bacteroidales bacterium]